MQIFVPLEGESTKKYVYICCIPRCLKTYARATVLLESEMWWFSTFTHLWIIPEEILVFSATGKNFTWLNIRYPVDIHTDKYEVLGYLISKN